MSKSPLPSDSNDVTPADTALGDDQSQKALVGKISAAYGLKGWFKVYSHTEPLEQIFDYAPWLLKKGSKSLNFKPIGGKKQGKGLVATAEGFEDRNQVDALLGYEIWVDQDKFSTLDDGEYYWHQLQGLKVYNEQEELLGEVSHLLETGANDVLVLNATNDSIDDQERLIPYVEDEFILQIDIEQGSMRVKWDADY